MTIPQASSPPFEQFHFCPRCGTAFTRSEGPPNPRFAACDHCGFRLYFNIACGLGALITDADGRLLMVRRAKEPSKGLLGFPGGFADAGEDAETGLRREVFEEVGLEVGVTEYLCSHQNLYAYRGTLYSVLDFFYICRVTSSGNDPLRLQSTEVTGFEWCVPDSLDPEDIAFPSMRYALRCYNLKGKSRQDERAFPA